MKIGIVGLGLIGGSFARAFREAGHSVFAFDTNAESMRQAREDGTVTAPLTDDIIPECDLILVCVYPEAAMAFMTEKAPLFGKKPVVMDSCGTKRAIVGHGMALAKEYGFTYAGGHPMAGTEFSGYAYSRSTLFKNAPMAVVLPEDGDEKLLAHIESLLAPVAFGSIKVTTAEDHDAVIAFTSQLPHVISSAYVKSPVAPMHAGLSAGSYKDMSRVARSSPEMWAQLFLEDSDNLAKEIDCMIEHLKEYRDAVLAGDREELIRLYREGREIKININ